MMSILRHTSASLCTRLLDKLLPQSCLLCGADSPATLCPDCCGDLPRLPQERCPHCAEPTARGERCGRCLVHPPHFDAAHAVFRYDFPVDRLIHALKYGHQLALAGWFGRQMGAGLDACEADCLLPLPLHPERLQERGFNQAAEIARSMASACSLPLARPALSRRRPTASQAELPLEERASNVRGAFECAADLAGRRILLVDDVMTSGATMDEAARTLKLHGAARVEVAIVARALRD